MARGAPKSQVTFRFVNRGGARKNAGRKRVRKRPGVPHRVRSPFQPRHPLLVTLRLAPGLPNLRAPSFFRVVATALATARERLETRIVHYSVQSDHLHLLVESRDARALSRALKGLSVRIAKGLNRILRRRGRIFDDRYHARILRTPREVKSALAYVFHNVRKHQQAWARLRELCFDPLSSAAFFEGFSRKILAKSRGPKGAEPKTWLLRVGFRKHGLLDPAYVPGGP